MPVHQPESHPRTTTTLYNALESRSRGMENRFSSSALKSSVITASAQEPQNESSNEVREVIRAHPQQLEQLEQIEEIKEVDRSQEVDSSKEVDLSLDNRIAESVKIKVADPIEEIK